MFASYHPAELSALQFIYTNFKMISPHNCLPHASPLPQANRTLKPHLVQLLNGQENIIHEQNTQISKIQKQLKQVRSAEKKKRQRQLFELFKKKYDIQCKNRADFERQVRSCIRQIQAKVANIDKVLFKCMASDSTEISLPVNVTSSINSKFLFSSEFSNIPKSPNAIFNSPLEVGQVTNVDCTAILSQLCGKLEQMETIVEIVFHRLDKYTIENRNVQKLINAEKRGLEQEIESLKKEISLEVKEKEGLKKILKDVQAERVKWSEGLRSAKVGEGMKKLLSFDKEKLAQEVVKMMVNLSTIKKERDEKVAELAKFKQEEKKRYATFLEKLKEKKDFVVEKAKI